MWGCGECDTARVLITNVSLSVVTHGGILSKADGLDIIAGNASSAQNTPSNYGKMAAAGTNATAVSRCR